MKIKRSRAVAGVVAGAALVLSACGTDPAAQNNAQQPAAPAPSGTTNVECGGKSPLSAEGSSAQKGAIDIFAREYGRKCSGQQINYNPSGSGAGVKQFTAGQVDFGGSDSPLKDGAETEDAKKRCAGSEAWNLPLVVGPVAIAYNVAGVDKLALNPEVTAKIFSGAITKWNDPAIKAVKGNEAVNLPDKPIQVVFRSDESGTTDNFQKYLTAASKGAWTKGDGKQFKGGVGVGAEKSNGVVESAKATDGSITYVESAFAKDGVKPALLDSGSGPVELTAQNVATTLDSAKFKKEGTNDLALDLDAIYASNTPGAYPLLLVTYEIVCSKYSDPAVAKAVKAFLSVAATDGQAPLSEKGYVPISQGLQTKVLAAVNAIA
ncbi:phosphate ABC transporter substrate-binding protein PstS [Amycolatopsis suaedae]|uniref:Phosphate-binding protein n=1 Tax=Amycolatopsis suaedae TaxID=2510978 RepID=A0A4Q7JBV9_9PSEU|nr:phosphate ABC transporter substrate-binding protein PstS [Amycolatopsis suaedae]RZQ65321.1 phosphate ABC transporter substrate-binding protein PstS [Amycolatopsis suaedae]